MRRPTRHSKAHSKAHSTARKAAIGGAALLVVVGSTVAMAYVRSVTDKGTPVFWPSACTWISPDTGASPDLPLADVVDVLTRSIANWQTPTVAGAGEGCSFLHIIQDPPEERDAHFDRRNTLKFRTEKWCRPAETNNVEMCYSSSAAAITTVFYTSNPGHDDDGAIIDADIQMNNVNFTFVTVKPGEGLPPARPGTQIADLENTLTHELGHFQGLDHTCWDMAPPHQTTAPTDDAGRAIPTCVDVANKDVPIKDYLRITDATMYNYASPGEIIKRSPSADDVAGICGIYPLAKNPGTCERSKAPDSSNCSVGRGGLGAVPAHSWGAGLLLALGALAGLLRRARKTRRA